MYMTVDKSIFDDAFGAITMDGAVTYILHPSGTVLYSSDSSRLNQDFHIEGMAFTEKQDISPKRYREKIVWSLMPSLIKQNGSSW